MPLYRVTTALSLHTVIRADSEMEAREFMQERLRVIDDTTSNLCVDGIVTAHPKVEVVPEE